MRLEALALTIPHCAGEPPAYFAARVAARNCRVARQFAPDMELTLQRLADGCEADVRKLANLCGADYDDLMAEAHRKVDGMFLYKGQQLRKADLRRSKLHVCPQCLLDDIATADLPPQLAIHGRGPWLLSALRTCPLHEMALIELVKTMPVHDRQDWTTNAVPFIPQLEKLAKGATRRPPSALEVYMIDRLAGRSPESWLNEFPLYAALHVAELVGAIAKYGIRITLDSMSEEVRHEAGDMGTRIAAKGELGFLDLLMDLKKQYLQKRTGLSESAQGVFGKLYTVPNQGMVGPAYEPFKEAMARFIQDNFALGPDDVVLGKPVTQRRLHSIRSATVEYGFTAKRLRKLLRAEGLIDDLEAHDRDILFAAHHAERLFRREQDSLSVLKLERYINAPVIQTKILREAGFIKRYTAGDGMYDYYLKSEVDDFMSRLLAAALPVRSTPQGTGTLAIAAKRAYRPMAGIVQLVIDQKLSWVGRLEGVVGFASVLVNVEEVKAITKLADLPGLPLNAVCRDVLKTNYRVLEALIACDALRMKSAVTPTNRTPTRIIEFAELERFQREYVSLHMLAKELGKHMNALNQELRTKGILPANFAGVGATFYKRDEVGAPFVPEAGTAGATG